MITLKTVLMMVRIVWNIHSPLSDGLIVENVAELFAGTVKVRRLSSSPDNPAASKFSIPDFFAYMNEPKAEQQQQQQQQQQQ